MFELRDEKCYDTNLVTGFGLVGLGLKVPSKVSTPVAWINIIRSVIATQLLELFSLNEKLTRNLLWVGWWDLVRCLTGNLGLFSYGNVLHRTPEWNRDIWVSRTAPRNVPVACRLSVLSSVFGSVCRKSKQTVESTQQIPTNAACGMSMTWGRTQGKNANVSHCQYLMLPNGPIQHL